MSTSEGTLHVVPNEDDVYADEALRSVLRQFRLFSDDKDLEQRKVALQELESLAREWVKGEVQKMGLPTDEFGGVKLFTYGSFRLGVFTAHSDIDALLAGPEMITREMFMDDFHECLSRSGKVQHLNAIRAAKAPIIKMNFMGIDIDLMYACMPLSLVRQDLSIDGEDLFHRMLDRDKKTIRNLCGTRDTNLLLKLVPNPPVFRDALRFVRFWAKERRIYGNKAGYLANFTIAVMLARVCQIYPEDNSAMVLAHFFSFYNIYDWSEPITLCKIKTEQEVFGKELETDAFRVFAPDKYDKRLMPVLTPAFPALNSTANVNYGTFDLIKKEFFRADKIIKESGFISKLTWLKICSGQPFFRDHKQFYCIQLLSDDAAIFDSFKGFMESRLPTFASTIEAKTKLSVSTEQTDKTGDSTQPQPPEVLLHPLLQDFSVPLMKINPAGSGFDVPFHALYFIGICCPEGQKPPLDILEEAKRKFDEAMDGFGNTSHCRCFVGIMEQKNIFPAVIKEYNEKCSVKKSHVREASEELEKEKKRRAANPKPEEPPEKRRKED